MSEYAGEGPEWDLAFPFVLCQSNGGPYEDEAFVAGFRCAQVYQVLKHTRSEEQVVAWESPLPRVLERQLDLIAMHLGWMLTAREDPKDCDNGYHTFRRMNVAQPDSN